MFSEKRSAQNSKLFLIIGIKCYFQANMKTFIIIWLLIVFYSSLFAQYDDDDEITLYDSDGAPVAYISIEGEYTIYNWDGEPVSYLEKTGGDISIYKAASLAGPGDRSARRRVM